MDPINERKMFQKLVRAASQPNTPHLEHRRLLEDSNERELINYRFEQGTAQWLLRVYACIPYTSGDVEANTGVTGKGITKSPTASPSDRPLHYYHGPINKVKKVR
ncbi:hypothetical protein E2562_027028 [Oryza meyeriana var. granulata]|uniref:Uncharacterized protein n=1 Tax=Oryza meyeriana var. granulata TaxID=110450 RepID=A0A6G1CAN4_9ORYZ|nr:hypothetical protein E2562_027028 [Oryza meyeriana var. granulata]